MATCSLGIKLITSLVLLLTLTINSLQSATLTVTGNLTVPNLKEVQTLKNSYLTVRFLDISTADAPATVLGKHEKRLADATKIGLGAEPLSYIIVSEKPKNLNLYFSVSAVVNVGWKPGGGEWLRPGDFHTDTVHDVILTSDSDHVVANIEMVRYENSALSTRQYIAAFIPLLVLHVALYTLGIS